MPNCTRLTGTWANAKWGFLSNKTKSTVATCRFDEGKEHALQEEEANKMEDKQHDSALGADDEDVHSAIEAKNH